MSNLEQDLQSPFHPNNAVGYSLIMQMRNYDVLMAILNRLEEDYEQRSGKKLNPKASDLIYDAHERGIIISGLPAFVPQESETTDE